LSLRDPNNELSGLPGSCFSDYQLESFLRFDDEDVAAVVGIVRFFDGFAILVELEIGLRGLLLSDS
jgi:hypothetical protein